MLKIFPDGHTQNTVRRLNPEMPIPPGTAAIHGISDADVADCPTFLLIAEKLFRYIEDCMHLQWYNNDSRPELVRIWEKFRAEAHPASS